MMFRIALSQSFVSKILLVLVVSLTALIGLAGCKNSGNGKAPIKLSEADANRTIELRVGDKLDVSLEGNLTTGYTWEMLPQDPAVLKQVGEAEFKSDSQALGSGGQIMLHFQAVAPGQAALKLVYWRSFEKNVAPLKTFEVNSIVK